MGAEYIGLEGADVPQISKCPRHAILDGIRVAIKQVSIIVGGCTGE
jgi:hypothetical protein